MQCALVSSTCKTTCCNITLAVERNVKLQSHRLRTLILTDFISEQKHFNPLMIVFQKEYVEQVRHTFY